MGTLGIGLVLVLALGLAERFLGCQLVFILCVSEWL